MSRYFVGKKNEFFNTTKTQELRRKKVITAKSKTRKKTTIHELNGFILRGRFVYVDEE